MDLMRRLKSAFIIIMVLPIFMIIGIGKLMLDYQTESLKNMYEVDSAAEQLFLNPMRMVNSITASIFDKIMDTIEKSPEKFEDLSYLNSLNDEIKPLSSFIAIRKGEELIYSGNVEKLRQVQDILLQHQEEASMQDVGTYISGKPSIYFKQQGFTYPDGTEGTVFVVTDVNMLTPKVKTLLIQIVVLFMTAIVITAVILIIWLYRSILRPLNTLRKATNEIIEGNLDYSITGDPDDEIGQLCCDFEEMRLHLKKLIDLQKQYEQDSRELISNISHDLKTPLTAIKGYSEGILDGVADTPDKRDRYMKIIYTKASDMTSLVDELSFFSEIDCKTVPYNFKIVSVSGYFEDCIDEISLDLELKNISLQYENEVPEEVAIEADAEQLKRVVNNIISNSVKYLDRDSGEIIVKIIQEEENIIITIEDDGQGIAEKDLPYIFDRFYRADASRNSSKGGTGLGLSIVKKIVADHFGKIWAESVEGKGTKITFTLPVYHAENGQEVLELEPLRQKRREKRYERKEKPWKEK